MTESKHTVNAVQQSQDNLPILMGNEPSLTAKQVSQQVHLIQQVMSSVMKDGEHYGVIPGCGNKPTLLKAGAEKLAMTFRFAPQYCEIPGSREEDGFIAYKIECRLSHIATGNFVGSGIGACNSREKKYLNANPWDIQNTLYKMACKRALVAAVLNATAASDIFTQDFDDDDISAENKKEPVRQPQRATQTTTHSSGNSTSNPDAISDPQRKRLFAIYKNAGITDDQMKDYLMTEYGIESTKDIKRSDYEAIVSWAQGNTEAGAQG